ncbi:cell wall anchor protein [Corynebacterium sp. ES2794-CONJ1]|uniref:cell wall anchor protein n=1 Tax=unclassified Corynebacterium TaxID=2624378 RepID=UPI00216A5AF1|nr:MULTISPECIES: cell wall anchor protein [unclassified Corynebacterium]MCS4489136.1 cell wall anchor protein [Corynebacterium sp. ES2775-CONJ]MCU9518537.1 cell wall anchor protein [Corynebacterium sp. ES2794-CONJ1]
MAHPRSIKASAFDIRNVIGALIGIYGVILVFAYLAIDPGIDPSTGMPKDAGYNLWVGLAMVGCAAVFFLWAKLNPVIPEVKEH